MIIDGKRSLQKGKLKIANKAQTTGEESLQDKLLDSALELPNKRQSSTSTLGLDPQRRGGEEVTRMCICQHQAG